MKNKAIGVFDSGIGGLTVYKALKEKLPRERVIYLGDTARVPYGSKSADTIIKFSEGNTLFLLTRNVKIIVVACNSSSAYALTYLQEKFDIPIIGVIKPGAEAAINRFRKKIGVIGTTATIKSGAYEKAIRQKEPGAEIVSKDCPLFVPLVEEGWLKHHVTRLVIEEYLKPLAEQHIDTLVLGCTHYPVLKPLIHDVLGDGVQLVDSALTTAEEVASLLKSLNWLKKEEQAADDEFYVTDSPERFRSVGEIFLDRKIEKVTLATFQTISLPQV